MTLIIKANGERRICQAITGTEQPFGSLHPLYRNILSGGYSNRTLKSSNEGKATNPKHF